jgi:hypothetical protein
VVRYEDFSMDPHNNTVDLFQFFGFAMHPRVVQFLQTHTTLNIGQYFLCFITRFDEKKEACRWF